MNLEIIKTTRMKFTSTFSTLYLIQVSKGTYYNISYHEKNY